MMLMCSCSSSPANNCDFDSVNVNKQCEMYSTRWIHCYNYFFFLGLLLLCSIIIRWIRHRTLPIQSHWPAVHGIAWHILTLVWQVCCMSRPRCEYCKLGNHVVLSSCFLTEKRKEKKNIWIFTVIYTIFFSSFECVVCYFGDIAAWWPWWCCSLMLLLRQICFAWHI